MAPPLILIGTLLSGLRKNWEGLTLYTLEVVFVGHAYPICLLSWLFSSSHTCQVSAARSYMVVYRETCPVGLPVDIGAETAQEENFRQW